MTGEKIYEAVVMGVSTGGLEALEIVLSQLLWNFNLPIMIVQHRSVDRDDFLHKYLDDICKLPVKEAEDKMPVKSGCVYLAPPNYHLMVEMDRTLSLSVDPAVNWSRPSIDVLFETAAEVYQERLVGVIMTGANNDGSIGLSEIKRLGGLCVVQTPESAVAPQMPLAALAAVEVDHLLTLSGIGPFLDGLRGRKDDG